MATNYSWASVLYSINPYWWAYFGIALALGFSILGAAW